MKRAIIILAILFLTVSVAYATQPCITCPQGPQGEQGIQGEQGEQGIQGEQGEQGEQGKAGENYTKDEELGVGMDLILWENKKETVAVKTEYKYDINNDEHEVYGVVQINLWDMFKKE